MSAMNIQYNNIPDLPVFIEKADDLLRELLSAQYKNNEKLQELIADYKKARRNVEGAKETRPEKEEMTGEVFDDYKEVAYMLKHANQYGLAIEVVTQFAHVVGQGSFASAVEHGLCEWDI